MPKLITDFYAYNDGELEGRDCRQMRDNPHWVGDLAIDCRLDVKNDRGSVTLELVKGGKQFRCRIDLTNGEARLSISDKPDFAPLAQTPVRTPGPYTISFANVDEQLTLWVNGKAMKFSAPTSYSHLGNTLPVNQRPVPGAAGGTDLSPVGIAIDGGAQVAVCDLEIRRDVYYIADPGLRGFADEEDKSRILDLQDGHFFMLGDNSPRSADSRYWRGEKYVDRRLLIGKALFIYWPHSFNYIEVGKAKIPCPYWPNFGGMRFVH